MAKEKEEREYYIDSISEMLVSFLNDTERDSSTVANQFIKTFRILDVKAQCMVRAMMFHLGQFATIADCHEEELQRVSDLVGLNINMLVDIAMDEWDELNKRLD